MITPKFNWQEGQTIWSREASATAPRVVLPERGDELRSIRLRAGYILGTCRGEEEMKAEARAIIELLDRLELAATLAPEVTDDAR